MKLIIDIPNNKAASFLEVIRSISFVKVKPISDAKAILLTEIREAIEEMTLIKQGKLKSRPVEELLNEL